MSVGSITRFFAFLLFAASLFLTLYGLFVLLYNGDEGGDGGTYVMFAGHRTDAHLAGGIALGIAIALTALGIVARRRLV
jgi:hypothetical protein